MNGHIEGEVFRIIATGFAAFVVGTWLAVAWWQLRSGAWKHIERHEAMLGAALLSFIIGYTAIQVEAVWLNQKAVLLWGNLAFPVGMTFMLFWLLQLIVVHSKKSKTDR